MHPGAPGCIRTSHSLHFENGVALVFPPSFRYYRPESLGEAMQLLTDLGPDARLLAGGHSLLPLMKFRMAAPVALIDLNRVPDLNHLEVGAETVRIGALVRHRSMEAAQLPSTLTILTDAASVIADVQVRTRGTVGGALAQADPGGDWGPVFLALDAAVNTVSPRGSREIPVRDLFVDAYTTDLAPDEILTEIQVCTPPERTGGAYLALKQRSGDFAIASAAVQLTLDENGICQRAGVALGNVGLTPIKAVKAEEILLGSKLDEETVANAVAAIRTAADPLPDLHGDEEYKRDLVGTLARRAIAIAKLRSSGERVDCHDYV
jgi:aerobic carbon-monoxide dehydrogenase medium subunit